MTEAPARRPPRPKLPAQVLGAAKRRTADLLRRMDDGDAEAYEALHGHAPPRPLVARGAVARADVAELDDAGREHVRRALERARLRHSERANGGDEAPVPTKVDGLQVDEDEPRTLVGRAWGALCRWLVRGAT